jgi:hypothetical protein
MSKHTPGPWIVIDQQHPYNDGSKSHIERGIYTQHIHPQLKDHYPVVCMSVGIGMTGAMPIQFVNIKEADARLIAAAPELLEALKVFCSLGRADSSTDWNVAFNEGAKAIEKATGEKV